MVRVLVLPDVGKVKNKTSFVQYQIKKKISNLIQRGYIMIVMKY